MIIRDIYSRCFSIAIRAHSGQTDKLGYAYIEHPMRVDEIVTRMSDVMGISDVGTIYLLKSIAMVHDVDEDYKNGLKSFNTSGFPDVFFDVITLLTHDKDTLYNDYIDNICTSRLSCIVKAADLLDNTDPIRIDKLKSIEPETVDRLQKKYSYAIDKISKQLNFDITSIGW
jgi:hypothetical protein